ncbi:hypothetical protein GQ44DRAFT_308233 [Phaeosphaeriaceae sp. PMI808]|nr:hypothetical protein GQ44DRAFT_308233 [Phaeosphaeriaceae sp. PMI808]
MNHLCAERATFIDVSGVRRDHVRPAAFPPPELLCFRKSRRQEELNCKRCVYQKCAKMSNEPKRHLETIPGSMLRGHRSHGTHRKKKSPNALARLNTILMHTNMVFERILRWFGCEQDEVFEIAVCMIFLVFPPEIPLLCLLLNTRLSHSPEPFLRELEQAS